MAVIVSNGNTNLSTVNGFYRAEAFNVGMFSATAPSLASARDITVTFANAGNCQGLVICLAGTTGPTKSVVVKLQENVATVWTDRASKTLTDTDLMQGYNATSAAGGGFIVPFTFTAPYAVDTSAGKWRFDISQTSTGTDWFLRTSDGVNPFFVTWCDNAVTFADNDCPVAKDIITIDQTATFKGVLGTGDVTRSVCAIVCRNQSTPLAADVSNMVWSNPPAASYTLTIDGTIVISTRGGFRVGTSAARIPYAQKAVLNVIAATSGTATISGFYCSFAAAASKGAFFLYGEIPAVEDAIIASDAAIAQAVINTTTNTGWVNGDQVYIGGQNVKGNGETTVYTVQSVTTTAITLTGNIATNIRKAGGHIIRLNGYGVELLGASSAPISILSSCNHLVISGVRARDLFIQSNGNSLQENTALLTQQVYEHSSQQSTGTQQNSFVILAPAPLGALVDNVNACRTQVLFPQPTAQQNSSGPMVFTNNIALSLSSVVGASFAMTAFPNQTFSNNAYENAAVQFFTLSGVELTFQNNTFYGNSVVAVDISTLVNSSTMGGNVFNNNTACYRFQSARMVNSHFYADIFGSTQANTTDLGTSNGTSFIQNGTWESPVGTLTILNTAATNAANLLVGTIWGVTNVNAAANDDRGYGPFTNFQRTGDGLSDTTVRTSGTGKYAIRIQPTSSTILSKFPQTIPTGNIQNKTMTVTCWVYINNAAYYAGTHTKPQLVVNYDNGTLLTATATATAGSWQQLAVTFTPTTTYGQIIVTVQGNTDASGTNAYFYVDDFNVAYPAGVSLDVGGLDLWAFALPVLPTIATYPALAGVWDEATSAHAVSGSYGVLAKQLLTTGTFVALK